jgi:hypothetical protein
MICPSLGSHSGRRWGVGLEPGYFKIREIACHRLAVEAR